VATRVALLSREHIERLPERARDVVEYRKSGLSLNHMQGCALDCAYYNRHTYGLWDLRQPRAPAEQATALIRDRVLTFFAAPKKGAGQAVITEWLMLEIER
jgi:hypothetical protein